MNIIDLTVIVPVYNSESYLTRCVESIWAASIGLCIEIILVNDGSLDRSGVICDSLAQSNSSVIVIHQENRGVSVARNNGLALARGQYIIFIDSDDWIKAGSLTTLCGIAMRNDCDIVQGQFIGDVLKGGRGPRFGHVMSGLDYLISAVGARSYDIVPVLKLTRLSYLKGRGLNFMGGVCYEDHLFALQLMDDPHSRVMRVDLPFYFYENNPTSITKSFSLKKLEDICQVYVAMERHVKNRPVFGADGECEAFKILLAVSYYHISSVYARVKDHKRRHVVHIYLKGCSLAEVARGFKMGFRMGVQNVAFNISPFSMTLFHSWLMWANLIKR